MIVYMKRVMKNPFNAAIDIDNQQTVNLPESKNDGDSDIHK